VLPGERATEAKNRIVASGVCHPVCLPKIALETDEWILNDDDVADSVVRPFEVLRFVVPDRAKGRPIFRLLERKGEPGPEVPDEQAGPYDEVCVIH
jgi:hypothetical protein